MKYTSSILAALVVAALPAFGGTAPSGKSCSKCVAPVIEEPSFSYNYLEAGWTHLNFDDFGSTDGYYVHGSFSPVNNVFLFGEWGQDFGNPDRDLIDLGVGVYIPLVKRVHWVTTAGAGWVDTQAFGVDEDGWAFNASTGLRIRTCPKSEIEIAYNFSAGDGDTDHGASAALLYNLTPKLQLVARGHFSADENGFGAGLRYNF